MNGKYEPVLLVNPDGDLAGHLLEFLESVMLEASSEDPELDMVLEHIRSAREIYKDYQESF